MNVLRLLVGLIYKFGGFIKRKIKGSRIRRNSLEEKTNLEQNLVKITNKLTVFINIMFRV